MSKLKRFGAIVLSLCVLLCAVAVSASAAGYTYTVTLYSGNHAVFSDGSETMVISNLSQGDIVNFSPIIQSYIQLNDDTKYYVKGVRLSGRDNSSVDATAFTVDGDAMYVVAYGIKGDMVAYTVNFLDEEGNALAPSQTLYGNVGDKPVVAFTYVEGYMPQAYNLTKTLSANEAENVFDFIYSQIEVPAAPVAPAEPGAEPAPEEPAAPAPAGPVAPVPGVVIPIEEPATPLAPGEEGEGGEETEPTGPATIIDLDDNETPLAGPDGGLGGTSSGGRGLSTMQVAGIAFGGGGGAAALIALAIILAKKKRRKA